MNYFKIEKCSVSNGDGLRTVLWVSGCEHHCKNCQNPQTWDNESGISFGKDELLEIAAELEKPYISGLTLSGGDPLHKNNRKDILSLLAYIKARYPQKTIWLYTGYTWEELDKDNISGSVINTIFHNVDILIDGKYEHDKRDITLPWRGSSNQRVIDVKKSLESRELVLYES